MFLKNQIYKSIGTQMKRIKPICKAMKTIRDYTIVPRKYVYSFFSAGGCGGRLFPPSLGGRC